MTDDTPISPVETAALVATGGFAGATVRYLVDISVGGATATLAVNVAGAGLLGTLLYRALYTGRLGARARLVAATGFLSSLTTYSAFALHAFRARPAAALGYVAATYALGFAAVLAGRTLARRRWGAGEVDG